MTNPKCKGRDGSMKLVNKGRKAAYKARYKKRRRRFWKRYFRETMENLISDMIDNAILYGGYKQG